MTVESATYISDLNTALPGASDQKSEGDDHIRLVKSTVKATFPNVTGAVTATHTVLNSVTSGVQDYLTAVSGTDTITATSPYLTAYAAGRVFRFITAGANTAASPTLNINTLGAKSILSPLGAALNAADLPSGALVEVVYNGTAFQMITPVVAPSGTYTPTATLGTNCSASTPAQFQYIRADRVVTASGLVAVTPTASATFTSVDLSLPISSAFVLLGDCSGVGVYYAAGATQTVLRIQANTVAPRMTISFLAPSTGSLNCMVHLTYLIR